jgi:hypothetical protein
VSEREYADPDCPHCGGSGFIYGESMLDGGHSCTCTLDFMRRQNMEKVWPSLSEAKGIPGLRLNPPLIHLTHRDVWITAKEPVFKAHLQAVCYARSYMWDAKVWSDKDLVKAWLNTAYAQGHKIYDTELDSVRVTAMYIDELVESYELVVLLMGVKEAPNKETPSVLLEAIKTRLHLGRPTWVVDQPQRRLDRVEHRAYSEVLEGLLSHWPHVALLGPTIKIAGAPIEPAHPVSDADVDDLIDEGDAEAGAVINEALSDVDEDAEAEIEDEAEEPQGPATRNLLAEMAQNEDVQEQAARRKRFKQGAKKPRRGGK